LSIVIELDNFSQKYKGLFEKLIINAAKNDVVFLGFSPDRSGKLFEILLHFFLAIKERPKKAPFIA
jgi:hypothetical protein